jgi:uncharacterized damage-inducible protein DinB
MMKTQLVKTLENSRSYTLQVAEAMPEKQYDTKPDGAGWNFRELLHHIAYGIQWWEQNYIKGKKTDWAPTPTKKNRKEILAYLNSAYDELEAAVKGASLSEEAVQGFHATIDHITHHRGQAVLHLRVQGIEPPEYTY